MSGSITSGSESQAAIVRYSTDPSLRDGTTGAVELGSFDRSSQTPIKAALTGLEPATTYYAQVRLGSIPRGYIVDGPVMSFTTADAPLDPEPVEPAPSPNGGGGNSPLIQEDPAPSSATPTTGSLARQTQTAGITAAPVWASDLPAPNLETTASFESIAETVTRAQQDWTRWWPAATALAIVLLIGSGYRFYRLTRNT